MSFNVVMILLFIYVSTISSFMTDLNEKTLMSDFAGRSPGQAILIGIVVVTIALAGATALFKTFWNRLITDLFPIRALDTNEALAVIMIMALFI